MTKEYDREPDRDDDDGSVAKAPILTMVDRPEFDKLPRNTRITLRTRLRNVVEAATYYSTPRMARALGISDERVRQLTAEGVLRYAGKNKYNRDATTRRYCAWQRDESRLAARRGPESRVREARAIEIEMRTAERARRLIATEEALESNAAVCGFVRTEFGGLAARVTRDLVLRRDIEKAVNNSFARIASRCVEEARNLETGGATFDADADDAAGSMGEDESALPAVVGNTGSA